MIHIYDSIDHRKKRFVPLHSNTVKIYVCGMTVYDYCHLGHARVMVVFDMVTRWLRARGYEVCYVRNITDIDDKIIARAKQNNEPINNLTERFIAAMNQDAQALSVLAPSFAPKATQYVEQMKQMITQLIEKGLAYQSNGNEGVYFSVRNFARYGKLSGKNVDDLLTRTRVDVAEKKRDPLDFVLWKQAKPDEPGDAVWDSPWGQGRPGWHIECSAMAYSLLGETIDIHGGGADLQFPHHENEIAQSEGAHGATFAKYWMHNGFVNINEEKISKSLGNFLTIKSLLKEFNPEVLRFFILRSHYRNPLSFSDTHIQDAKNTLTRLYNALHVATNNVPNIRASQITAQIDDWKQRFYLAMDDDFNTPQAIALLFEVAHEIRRFAYTEYQHILRELAHTLGLLTQDPLAFLQSTPQEENGLGVAEIENKIEIRNQAKAKRDFALSDNIRDELAQHGIQLEDRANGEVLWKRV